MKIIDIPVNDIDVGERLRAIDADWVGMLAASIEARGLINPITVGPMRDGRYPLIAGAHRLAAVKKIGAPTVPAIRVEVDALGKRFVELSENIFRRELNPIDRAAHLGELKRVWELLYPHQRNGAKGLDAIMRLRAQAEKRRPDGNNCHLEGDGLNQEVTDHPPDQADQQAELPFAAMASGKLGMAPRTVRLFTFLHQRLQPDVASVVSTLPIADKLTEVLALARLVPSEQRAVAAVLAEQPYLTSVRQILSILHPNDDRPTLSKAEQADNRLRAAWAKAPESVRRSFMRRLAETGAIERYVGRSLFDEAPPAPLKIVKR